MGAIETAKLDFRMIFWDFWLRVNYYYPPDGSLRAANGKNLLHEVRGFKFLSGCQEAYVGEYLAS
jgi:hypothetical protein